MELSLRILGFISAVSLAICGTALTPRLKLKPASQFMITSIAWAVSLSVLWLVLDGWIPPVTQLIGY